MKKVLSLALCVMMMLSSITTFAATKEVGAYETGVDIYNVYVEGKADVGGQSVAILLMDDLGNIGYINELVTAGNGKYETKFKFNGDIDNYEVKVRDSLTNDDITQTVETAFAKKDVYCVDVAIKNVSNDVAYYISEDDFVDVVVDINNKYGDDTKVKIMIAAYNENNKLLATKAKTLNIGFGDLDIAKKVNFSDDFRLPEGTVKAKAFAWQDTVNLMPLAKEDVKKTFDGNLTFVNKNENPDDYWVVGLAGASTVHAGEYALFLYQYYATRYPGKNIVILNKGAAGCTAEDIYNRLEWDIFNEKDPLGYGACDEIAIMVGANDVGYASYTYGKMDDDEYLDFYSGRVGPDGKYIVDMGERIDDSLYNYEEIVKWCRANGKGVTFTPMTLYDESDAFETTLSYGVCYGSNFAFGKLSDGLKELAEKYDVPFIDTWGMSNEYTERIRKEYGASLVITGTDGLHHSQNGGYLVGYIIARGQETDEIVAAVEIDATTNTSTTDGATVSGLSASSTGVSYTYLADALPMYAKAPGYIYAEGYGVDITNTMNKEIIKVTGLQDGNYTIKIGDNVLCTVSNKDLENGVNIATLENNPGQIQAKGIYENYAVGKWGATELEHTGRRNTENILRNIFNEELRMRNYYYRYCNDKVKKGEMSVNEVIHPADPSYKEYTADDWIKLCEFLKEAGYGTANAKEYPERKRNQQHYVDMVKYYIDNTAKDAIPQSHVVEISKVQ